MFLSTYNGRRLSAIFLSVSGAVVEIFITCGSKSLWGRGELQKKLSSFPSPSKYVQKALWKHWRKIGSKD